MSIIFNYFESAKFSTFWQYFLAILTLSESLIVHIDASWPLREIFLCRLSHCWKISLISERIAFIIFHVVERLAFSPKGLPLSSFALSKESPYSFGLPLSSFALSKELPYSLGLPLSSFALSKESPCSFGLPFIIFRVVERIALFLWIAFIIFRIVERIALFLRLTPLDCLCHLSRCRKNLVRLPFIIFRIVERIALFLWIAFCHLSRCRKNRLVPLDCLYHLSHCRKNRLVPLDCLCHLSHCRKNRLVPLDCLLSSFALSKELPCSFGLPFVIFRVVERIALFLWIAFLSSFALSKESPFIFCVVERIAFIIFRIVERIALFLWITFVIFRVVERLALFRRQKNWITFVIFRVVERLALFLWITFVIFRVVERIALFLWIILFIFCIVKRVALLFSSKEFALFCLSRCRKSYLILVKRLPYPSFTLSKDSRLTPYIHIHISQWWKFTGLSWSFSKIASYNSISIASFIFKKSCLIHLPKFYFPPDQDKGINLSLIQGGIPFSARSG